MARIMDLCIISSGTEYDNLTYLYVSMMCPSWHQLQTDTDLVIGRRDRVLCISSIPMKHEKDLDIQAKDTYHMLQ